MSYISLPGITGQQLYFTQEEAAAIHNQDSLQLYKWAHPICEILHIDCPLMICSDTLITQINEYTHEQNQLSGISYHKEDHPNLTSSFVWISFYDRNRDYLKGVLAHELRHVWQAKQPNYKAHKHYQSASESVNDLEEIDADAFSIWYLSTLGLEIEYATELMCPGLKKHYPKAYEKRIQCAYELKSTYDNVPIKPLNVQKPLKESFIKKLFRRLRFL